MCVAPGLIAASTHLCECQVVATGVRMGYGRPTEPHTRHGRGAAIGSCLYFVVNAIARRRFGNGILGARLLSTAFAITVCAMREARDVLSVASLAASRFHVANF